MLFRISKCLTLGLLICIYYITIVESKKKVVTEETPKEMSESDKAAATEETPSEVVKSQKEDIEELEKLEKEDEAEQAADTKKELAEIEEVLTEASKDLAEFEKIAEEFETESPKEEEKEKSEEKSEVSAEESGASTLESTDTEEKSEGKMSVVPTMTTIEKQEAPKDTFVVWNSKGKICLLAKFNATFSIKYASEQGEQKAEVSLPSHANVKGKCESTTSTPLMQISWLKYVFSIMFNKTEDEENWIVTSMELSYDTSEPLFDRATNVGKKTARSKVLSKFETPLDRSHFCPAKEVVMMYTGNKEVATAILHNVNLQPYGVEDAKFSPAYRCNKVVLDEESYIQDETVPLAVGLTLALITLFVLVGFSVHRAYNAAKVDYNTMP